MNEYNIIFNKLQKMVDEGTMTIEEAADINKKAFEKYEVVSSNPDNNVGGGNVPKEFEVADKAKVVDGTTVDGPTFENAFDNLSDLVEEETIDIIDFVEILEAALDDDEEVVTEGENLEITKSTFALKKEIKAVSKDIKKALKAKDYAAAHKHIAKEKKILEAGKKRLQQMKTDEDKPELLKVLEALIGAIIGACIVALKYIIMNMLIIGVAGALGAGAGAIATAKGLSDIEKAASVASTTGSAVAGGQVVMGVEGLRDELDILVAHENEIKEKKADYSALNLYKQVAVKDITRTIKALDRLDKKVSKKEKADKEAK